MDVWLLSSRNLVSVNVLIKILRSFDGSDHQQGSQEKQSRFSAVFLNIKGRFSTLPSSLLSCRPCVTTDMNWGGLYQHKVLGSVHKYLIKINWLLKALAGCSIFCLVCLSQRADSASTPPTTRGGNTTHSRCLSEEIGLPPCRRMKIKGGWGGGLNHSSPHRATVSQEWRIRI